MRGSPTCTEVAGEADWVEGTIVTERSAEGATGVAGVTESLSGFGSAVVLVTAARLEPDGNALDVTLTTIVTVSVSLASRVPRSAVTVDPAGAETVPFDELVEVTVMPGGTTLETETPDAWSGRRW